MRHRLVESGDERGSGGVLALAVLALVTVLALAAIGLGVALAARQRAIAAADSGALAAADTALGIHPGAPCLQAAAVVETYDARLASCDLDGVIATVTVSVTVAGIVVNARARAGPPR
ncbi:MAG: Rv3654c family TadE-like protein [Pseudolysinimonas sp.]|uniref:Rv3654c family TadE-like protein n=1 Tax=Pseudolysinimonas sp. TaxID=2680009 RepID=UPI003262F9FA